MALNQFYICMACIVFAIELCKLRWMEVHSKLPCPTLPALTQLYPHPNVKLWKRLLPPEVGDTS